MASLTVAALTASMLVVLTPAPASTETVTDVGATLVWKRAVGAISQSSPLPIDLDGDGRLEVVTGDYDGLLHAFRADGTSMPGWPQKVEYPIDSPPSAADTDNDGRPEVFVGSGRATIPAAGALYSFDHDGRRRWKFQGGDPHNDSLGIVSAPAIGDINRDQVADVTFGAIGQNDFSLNERGQLNAGWPFFTGDTTFSSAALADVNGDGQTDILIGNDASDCAHCGTSRGGVLHAIDGSGRSLWEYRVGEIVKSSPAVGDIDGDGVPEIAFGTGEYWWYQNPREGKPRPADSTKVFVVDLQGRLKWSRDTGGVTMGSPAMADVNGDGTLDLTIASWVSDDPAKQGRVFAWNGAGDILPGFPVATGGGESPGGVVTADLNGDGREDILAPTPRGLYVRSGRDGSLLLKLTQGTDMMGTAPAVTDLDGDGKLDILVTAQSDGKGAVYRYELNDTRGKIGPRSWPIYRKDARRTGSWTNPPLTQTLCPAKARAGYWLAAADGGIFSYCSASFYGSTGGMTLNQPVVGMAPTPTGKGYWFVATDGGIFAYGDANFYGSTGAITLNQPIVGMAPTPTGNGYWLVASDGGIFAYGDANFYGSTGAITLNQPIVGMAPTPTGNGYWLVASDGGIFAYGDANFYGSTGAITLNQPIVGMEAMPKGGGYWMVASDGGIFSFGNAGFHGSTGAASLEHPVAGMAATKSGEGYWVVTEGGSVFAFGDAPFLGELSVAPNAPVRDIAPLP